MALISPLSASQALVSEIQNKTNTTQQNGVALGHVSSRPGASRLGSLRLGRETMWAGGDLGCVCMYVWQGHVASFRKFS